MMKTTPTGSNASILRSLQMKAAVRKTMVMFVVCLVFGIINWVALGLPLLPTISDTWTKPPASYISRYVVGASSILFQVANFVIYRANQDVGKYAKASWVNKLSLVLSVVSVFALSWIGAVCDSKSSTCRGDNNVHMMFAYTFFIGYNMYMVIESVRAHKQLSCCAKVITTVCVLATVALKLRVVPSDLDFSNGLLMETNQSIAAGLGDSFVAIFEWIDVLVVVVWTGTYAIHRGQGWSLATVQLDSGATKATRIVAADGTRVLNRVTAFTFATVVALVMTVLLISTFVVEVFITKAVPLPAVFGGNASWPLESALWVSAPGNWLARWALVFSAVFLLSYNSLAVITMRRQLSACLCCLTQFFGSMGALGVALSGCVDEYEESSEHALFMCIGFAGLNIFAVALSIARAKQKKHSAMFIAIVVTIVLASCRSLLSSEDTDDDADVTSNALYAILQWLNTFVLLIFITFFTYSKFSEFQNLAMAITYKDPSASNIRITRGGKKSITVSSAPVVTYAASNKDFDESNAEKDVVVTARLVKVEI